LLEQQLLKAAREKESCKKMSSRVILAQPRSRARAPMPSTETGNAETHVLNSSEEEEGESQLATADFAMVNQP
jgi:hypothetical protein